MLEIADTHPCKKTEIGMYSEMFFATKVKPAFDALWEGCLQSGFDLKHRINLVKKMTKEAWDKEPEDVKSSIWAKCEEEYAQAITDWKARNDWTGSAEDFDS
jgi:hypothetical protein